MTHNSSGTSTVMSTITTMASGHPSSSSSNTTILHLNLRLVLHHGLPSLHRSSLLFYQHPHNSQLRQLTFQPLHLMPDNRQGASCLHVSKHAEINSALIWMWPVVGAFSDSSLFDGQQYMRVQQGCCARLIGWFVLNVCFDCMQSHEGSGSNPRIQGDAKWELQANQQGR